MLQSLLPDPIASVLNSLAAALDLIDVGILLLDRDLRVRFLNLRQREIFELPASLLDNAGMEETRRPTFRDLLDHAASKSWFAVDADELPEYLEQREAAVREGWVPPTRIDLRNGKRLLFSCAACGDGGRILTYTDISEELIREMSMVREMIDVETRFRTETLEDQAAYLVAIAETADQSAREVEQARRELELQIGRQAELEAELRRMATTDGLTGALNRSGFLIMAQQRLEQMLDGGLGVLMLDVDHFKMINDRYGHAGGDAALRHLVAELRGGVRQVDLLGRLGGEEFALVLPVSSPRGAIIIAERLRRRIEKTAIELNNCRIAMTVSIGLAVRNPEDRLIEQIIARADAALYQAKGSGRNRVVVADS